MLHEGVGMSRLLGLVAEVGDDVVAILGLLQTTEGHLGSGNVLLGVLEVLELQRVSRFGIRVYRHTSETSYKSILVPLNTLLLVGVGVCETVDGTSLATEKAVKVGANLVGLALLQVMALCATSLDHVRRLHRPRRNRLVSRLHKRTLKRLAPFLASPIVILVFYSSPPIMQA